MEFFKLQFGCILVVIYVGFMYFRERAAYKIKACEPVFETLLFSSLFCIALDGTTAWTVNHLEIVPPLLNRILHLLYFFALDFIVFIAFIYIISILDKNPRSRKTKFLFALPFVLSLVAVLVFIPQLEYRSGNISNYSMGISALICYVVAAFYLAVGFVAHLFELKNLGHNKMIVIQTYLTVSVLIVGFQGVFPQLLVTSIVPALSVLAAYLNIENPVFTKLRRYNSEMVMGFATLVENRDENTGGHIKRTTEYVRLLADELKSKGFFSDILTDEYIKNLVMAAPLHDVGKIAIPDSILLKPGKLDFDEFEKMKTHAERGGRIIKETFSGLGDDEYEKIAYEVARHHHEKWNGKGYPDKISGGQIPLCARIMAVADVFDAVSAKRCYRDALPLEKCFKIIEEGAGEDFDPVVVRTFLEMKQKITQKMM